MYIHVHRSINHNNQKVETTKLPSMDVWTHNLWSTHTMEYYPAFKRKSCHRCRVKFEGNPNPNHLTQINLKKQSTPNWKTWNSQRVFSTASSTHIIPSLEKPPLKEHSLPQYPAHVQPLWNYAQCSQDQRDVWIILTLIALCIFSPYWTHTYIHTYIINEIII